MVRDTDKPVPRPPSSRGKLTPPDVRPLLYHSDGRILMSFVRDALVGLDWIPRTKGLPWLTAAQVKALDAVQATAHRHQRVLAMQPGDLTFVNNLCLLHAREAFENGHDPDADQPLSQTRYLVRLWLRNARLALQLPPQLAAGNRRLFDDDGARDGIEEDWNIVYKPRLQFKLPEKLSP